MAEELQGDQKVSVQLTIAIPTQLMIWRWPSQNTFGMCTVLYRTRSSRKQFGVSINVWRLAGDTLNLTCNFLYCNRQVHRDFLITLYLVVTEDSVLRSQLVLKCVTWLVWRLVRFYGVQIPPGRKVISCNKLQAINNVLKIIWLINTLRTASFKLFKRPFPGFLTILTL